MESGTVAMTDAPGIEDFGAAPAVGAPVGGAEPEPEEMERDDDLESRTVWCVRCFSSC
jgi:hypothetical protein